MAATLAGVGLLAAGCGHEPHRVPNVTGERLDVAQEELESAGLGYDTEGGGAFGVVVRSHWIVCRQQPKAGAVAVSVRLIVDRSCPTPKPPPRPGIVPNVTGERLDLAEDELERLGLRFETYPYDGAIVVRENWTVCSQYPEGGEYGEIVDLYVAHDCDDP